MGGAVSVRAAARRPDLVRTLTLVSAALPDRRPHRQTAHFPVIALPVLGDRLVRQFGRLPAEQRIAGVIQTCYHDPGSIHPARIALSVEELRRRDGLGYDVAVITGAARTLVAETLRPGGVSLWRDAARLRMPALVLFGSHDKLVSADLAGRAARTFPDARVVVLPDTGHLGQMEHPATVASLFREMVNSTRNEPGRGETRGMPGTPTRLRPEGPFVRAGGLIRSRFLRPGPAARNPGVRGRPPGDNRLEFAQCRCHRWLNRPPTCRSMR